jgi:hypothetical protein
MLYGTYIHDKKQYLQTCKMPWLSFACKLRPKLIRKIGPRCEIHGALDVFLCTASILNICLISLDRYWSITNSIAYLNQVLEDIFFGRGGGSATPCASPPPPWPSIFSD